MKVSDVFLVALEVEGAAPWLRFFYSLNMFLFLKHFRLLDALLKIFDIFVIQLIAFNPPFFVTIGKLYGRAIFAVSLAVAVPEFRAVSFFDCRAVFAV